jgi:hypothetical protein
MKDNVKIEFADPMNDDYEDISLTDMKKIIFDKKDDFWAVGSGTAKISYYIGGERLSFFSLSANEKFGFLINCGKSLSESKNLLYGENTEEIAQLFIAGDIVKVNRKAVVPKEVAWKAIEYFLQTGERNPDLTWGIAEMPEQDF